MWGGPTPYEVHLSCACLLSVTTHQSWFRSSYISFVQFIISCHWNPNLDYCFCSGSFLTNIFFGDIIVSPLSVLGSSMFTKIITLCYSSRLGIHIQLLSIQNSYPFNFLFSISYMNIVFWTSNLPFPSPQVPYYPFPQNFICFFF